MQHGQVNRVHQDSDAHGEGPTTKGTTDMEKYSGNVFRKELANVSHTLNAALLTPGWSTKEGICKQALLIRI